MVLSSFTKTPSHVAVLQVTNHSNLLRSFLRHQPPPPRPPRQPRPLPPPPPLRSTPSAGCSHSRERKSADERWIQFLTETARCYRGTEGNQPRICAEEAAELYLLKTPSRIADLKSRRRGGLPIAPFPARFCTREAV